jgi:hypothetical protein
LKEVCIPEIKSVASLQLTPLEVVEKMYMQINNILQGFAIAILIEALTDRLMNNTHAFNSNDFSTLLLICDRQLF